LKPANWLARAALALGVAVAALVAAVGAYLVPHLVRAADPGCMAYKGSGLDAYRAAIADLNEGRPAVKLTADGARAVAELRAAASSSPRRAASTRNGSSGGCIP